MERLIDSPRMKSRRSRRESQRPWVWSNNGTAFEELYDALGQDFHEGKRGNRLTISDLARLLKVRHERYAEDVKQGFRDECKARARAKLVAAAQGSRFGGEPAPSAAKPKSRN